MKLGRLFFAFTFTFTFTFAFTFAFFAFAFVSVTVAAVSVMVLSAVAAVASGSVAAVSVSPAESLSYDYKWFDRLGICVSTRHSLRNSLIFDDVNLKSVDVECGTCGNEIALGYEDAVVNYWPRTFDRMSEIDVKLTSIAHIHVDGKFASVVGTESAVLQPKAGGEPRKFDLFVTNLFEKDGDQWLMISHHAQMIPK